MSSSRLRAIENRTMTKRQASFDSTVTDLDDDLFEPCTTEDVVSLVSRTYKIITSFYQVLTAIPIYFQAYYPINFTNAVAYFNIQQGLPK